MRQGAQAIRKIVSSFPAVKYRLLHYLSLEEDKKEALRVNKGDYDKPLILSSDSRAKLVWWLHNVHSVYNNVEVSDPEVVISSDASKIGWGCECEGVTAEGQWQPIERQFHINYLELNAAFFLLKCFQSKIKGKHVRLMCDNMTTVACVNHIGTCHSSSCNSLTKDLWEWCTVQKVWIRAAHIPGVDNTAADLESRGINLDAEWKLNPERVKFALDLLGIVQAIDLFASRLNKQMNRFVAFRPDPAAVAVDAFSLSWKAETFLCFPPFQHCGEGPAKSSAGQSHRGAGHTRPVSYTHLTLPTS